MGLRSGGVRIQWIWYPDPHYHWGPSQQIVLEPSEGDNLFNVTILLKYTLLSPHKVHVHSHTPKFQHRAPTHTLKTLAPTFFMSRRFYLQIFVVDVMPLQYTRSHLDKCIPCSHERQDLIQHSVSGQKQVELPLVHKGAVCSGLSQPWGWKQDGKPGPISAQVPAVQSKQTKTGSELRKMTGCATAPESRVETPPHLFGPTWSPCYRDLSLWCAAAAAG